MPPARIVSDFKATGWFLKGTNFFEKVVRCENTPEPLKRTTPRVIYKCLLLQAVALFFKAATECTFRSRGSQTTAFTVSECSHVLAFEQVLFLGDGSADQVLTLTDAQLFDYDFLRKLGAESPLPGPISETRMKLDFAVSKYVCSSQCSCGCSSPARWCMSIWHDRHIVNFVLFYGWARSSLLFCWGTRKSTVLQPRHTCISWSCFLFRVWEVENHCKTRHW